MGGGRGWGKSWRACYSSERILRSVVTCFNDLPANARDSRNAGLIPGLG